MPEPVFREHGTVGAQELPPQVVVVARGHPPRLSDRRPASRTLDASRAGLDHLGAGHVTQTEVGDEDSHDEVEVTLDNGSDVDVQLDRDFQVVGEEEDGVGDRDD